MLKTLLSDLSEIVFPKICFTCKSALQAPYQHICEWCLLHQFPEANPEYRKSAASEFLPERIQFQHALWRFDKGGYLQDLLHTLKYDNLPGIGVDMGRELGNSLKNHPDFPLFQDARLMPVPLHPAKERKRGYNQARAIADGVSEATGLPVIRPQTVTRRKNTQTQTGFSLQERRENINQAFFVTELFSVVITPMIIIDDVFTTGATVFELAATFGKFSPHPIAVATVAQA